ncbi:efflux RND transporter permease subunit [Ketobacter sp. MCCC 1A13808]|uniref:efflux RND transporter permease subunit n=1 Tax=Ketobacter sp. MCCC 1A13808 TaxID=2602738 RepID=UPI0012EC4124|nr:efflux RND transporter permease subunit [Ketobacter sp. MCCC 1A13808]MVF14737.1 efflux RND transporter permease subunit [Ketobacter sp. MCCC 1A13808]
MNQFIDAAFGRGRTVVLIFVMLLLMGTTAYLTIPKESEPDVSIPIIYVSVTYEGISPEDSERLLVRPLEKELQAIEGLRELHATAAEGYASVTVELEAGFDVDKALQEVRDKVDIARAELPPGSDEPRVNEVNTSLFPVLTVVLSGPTPERELVSIARKLKDDVEALSDVLEVKIGGDREEVLEVIADPSALEAYNISFTSLFNFVQQNNRLVAAGALDTGAGRMVFKVPGVLENLEDLATLPIKVDGSTVVTFQDVATLHRTFKDPTSFARINGQSALALEVSKRSGANIIETIENVRAIVQQSEALWPDSVTVTYLQDKSERISSMLGDLENNVITAIILVMIVIVAALGVRPAILVGLAIPGSFLAGMLILKFMGITLNILVLFSLILVVGMLVDGAIVTIELADRKIAEGVDPKSAFAEASKRMSWPIVASTATTLAVFVPLLFWPGMVGEFMKYLPITVIITLIASLAMALIFIPVLGGMLQSRGGKKAGMDSQTNAAIKAAEDGDLDSIGGWVGRYLRTLTFLLRHPGKSLGVAVLCLVAGYSAYIVFGRGIEFFPAEEPDFLQVQVQARGDLSVFERDQLVRQVEKRMLDVPELKSVYARTIGEGAQTQTNMPDDAIGVIQLELVGWQQRPRAADIIPVLREKAAGIPGIKIQVREQESGPATGKPVEMEITGLDLEKMSQAVAELRETMNNIGGFVDVEDSRPLPSIEWRLKVDRQKAAQYGADVSLLGHAVTMITNGIMLAEYRPDDADEELEIRLRFSQSERNLDQLNRLRVPSENGAVPISNFVTFEPAQKTGVINRNQGHRILEIKAGVLPGLLPDDQVNKIKQSLENLTLPDGVNVRFKGQDEDIQEAMMFLINAFVTALFLMWIILVTQFNSFYQSLLVLSAIVFSTAGVLLGLLATGQAFGIVMGGIGVIALAGIVVNNNIVLIDTYNDLKKKGLSGTEAILRTAAQRMRPVFLTSVTTVLGLLPMVFALTIDIIGRDLSIGAPSAQMWTQLASAIAGGLTFATILTLFLTPCLLMIGENMSDWRAARARRRNKDTLISSVE